VTRDPEVFLRHVLMCVDRIDLYTRDGRDAFFADSKTQDAVVRNLEVIGQAVRDLDMVRLSQTNPNVPWAQIAAMRNVLAHQYLGVDLQLVWNVLQNELPGLRVAVATLLAPHEAEGSSG